MREAVWALNITVNDLGYSPFRLVHGRDAIVPIELTLDSYQVIMSKDEWTTDELLEFRMLQMKGLVEELKQARQSRDEIREKWKEFHDRHANRHKETITVGNLVLVYDSTLETTYSRKLDYRWMGPYKVRKIGKRGHII